MLSNTLETSEQIEPGQLLGILNQNKKSEPGMESVTLFSTLGKQR